MNVLFVNPPNTTNFEDTLPGKYIEENIGNQFLIIPRIPFQVMAGLKSQRDIQKKILLLDYEWYKNPGLTKEELISLVTNRKPEIVCTTLIAQASTDSLDYLTSSINSISA